MNAFVFPYPYFEEQQKIADFLSDFDTAIDLAKQALRSGSCLKGIVATDVCIIETEGICIMNKWEFTRYLIEAKKCVNSVLYMAEN